MCFQTVRAESFSGSVGEGEEEGEVEGLLIFVVEVEVVMGRVAAQGVLGLVVVTFWSLAVLAGVAVESRERKECVEGRERDAVSDKGEHGAVLDCSEGVGDAAPVSTSRDVSEIRIEGLSAAVSRERDLCAWSWFSRDWQISSMGCSFDAVGPRW